MADKVIPIMPQEINRYCDKHAEIGQPGGMIGGTQLMNIWYLMHNPNVEGGYAKGSADAINGNDQDLSEMVPLQNGEEFYLNNKLRKLQL